MDALAGGVSCTATHSPNSRMLASELSINQPTCSVAFVCRLIPCVVLMCVCPRAFSFRAAAGVAVKRGWMLDATV